MSAILELSIFPLDKGESLSTYVARAVGIVKNSGLPYVFAPMGTCVEGDYDAVMDVARRCFEAMEKDCDRINMTMRIDYRKKGDNRLVSKLQSVNNNLEESKGRA